MIGFDKKCLIRPRRGEGQGAGFVRNAQGGANRGGYAGSGASNRGNVGSKGAGNRNNVASGKAGRGTSDSGKKKTIRNVHKKKGK